jgi:hypothetical protein
MWRLKYFICLVFRHSWVGSNYQYCLRCGKLDLAPENVKDSIDSDAKYRLELWIAANGQKAKF